MIVTDTPAVREAAANVSAARVVVRRAVGAAEVLDYGRARTLAYNAVEAAEQSRDQLRADLERAVRAANPGAVEAELQAAVRAL